MGFSLSEMWGHMGLPARVVVGILVVMGLASLTVFIERILTLRRSRQASRRFAAESGSHRARRHDRRPSSRRPASTSTATCPRLVQWPRSRPTGTRARPPTSRSSPPAERTRRHLERYLEEVGADLRRGLAVLASVGSVAPFVGLLGTVVGIISAFQGIASARLGRPLLGLGRHQRGAHRDRARPRGRDPGGARVQLPHRRRSRATRAGLNSAAGELLDTIEDWAEERPSARAARDGGGNGSARGLVA